MFEVIWYIRACFQVLLPEGLLSAIPAIMELMSQAALAVACWQSPECFGNDNGARAGWLTDPLQGHWPRWQGVFAAVYPHQPRLGCWPGRPCHQGCA